MSAVISMPKPRGPFIQREDKSRRLVLPVRDPDEGHRAWIPPELLSDLVIFTAVVALTRRFIIRPALAILWLRLARNADHRTVALRFAL